MNFSSIFFIILSVAVIVYLYNLFRSNKRLPIIFELFALGVYALVIIIFLFPQTLTFIEDIFGIQSALNFIIYLSIFISYFLIFLLYQEKEQHRLEITKLTREIALMRKNQKKK